MSILTFLGGMPVAFIAATLLAVVILHAMNNRTRSLLFELYVQILYCTAAMLVFAALPFSLTFTSLTLPKGDVGAFVIMTAFAYGGLSITALCFAITILEKLLQKSKS